jgi:hypothetical protein
MPRHPDSYAQRGLVRLLQGRASEAQQDFDRCLELNNGLKQSLEQLIAEAKRQSAARASP